MALSDKTLQCADCGAEFVFTVEEQEFFASKGYTNDPKRCPTCRRNRRAQRPDAEGYQPRQMFSAVCAQCGRECEVPFEPRDGRPVYCSDCFSRMRSR